MLSFVTLSIAYFIEVSSTSFFIALVLGTVIGCLLRGNFISMISEIVGIMFFSTLFYKWLKPDDFLTFVGSGVLFSILNLILGIVSHFLSNRIFLLFSKEKISSNKNDTISLERDEKTSSLAEAKSLIISFLRFNGVEDFLKKSEVDYDFLRTLSSLNGVTEIISESFVEYLKKNGFDTQSIMSDQSSKSEFTKAIILISHYLIYERKINGNEGIHFCYNFSNPSTQLHFRKKASINSAILDVKEFAIKDKKSFLSKINDAGYEKKLYFKNNILRYSNVPNYDEEYNRILFSLFLHVSDFGFEYDSIKNDFLNLETGFHVFEGFSNITLVESIIDIMFVD